MSGKTILERQPDGTTRVILDEDGTLPGIEKDQSRLRHRSATSVPFSITSLRVLDPDSYFDMEHLNNVRANCVNGKIDRVVQGMRERGLQSADEHELCEVASQQAARYGQSDRIAKGIAPGQAQTTRNAIFQAALKNQGFFEVNGKAEPLRCELAFDEGFQRAHQMLRDAQADGVITGQEYENLITLELPQPDGTVFPLDITRDDVQAHIGDAQKDCFNLDDASTLDGVIAGWSRALEGPTQEVSSMAPANRRQAAAR